MLQRCVAFLRLILFPNYCWPEELRVTRFGHLRMKAVEQPLQGVVTTSLRFGHLRMKAVEQPQSHHNELGEVLVT